MSLNARLTSESVQGTSLAFQSVDDVHGGDCLALGVLGVGDCIFDHVLKEDLEDLDGWLGDTLDVVSHGNQKSFLNVTHLKNML